MTFLGTIHDLKLGLVLIVIVLSLFTTITYGQTSTELGYRLVPNKIVEDSEGILQVYVKNGEEVIPSQINNLIVASSDSSIIQILEIQKNENGFVTPVRIKAVGSGTTNIALAAPGFLSKEFPITVYGNKNNQEQLLIKSVPSDFSVNGPNKGYVSVELADEDGFPTRATSDITITLTTSQSDVLNLKNKELVIKKGEYFAVGEFQVNKPGTTLIYASVPSIETASSTVTVTEIDEPLTVQLYVYPDKISSFSTNYAYAIVQLQDSSGTPIISKENIPISVKITNADQEESVNTSGENPGVTSNQILEIKKGTYWGYTKLVTRGGQVGTYDINIFTKDYLVSSTQQLEIVNLELLDDKSAGLDLLPILATGQKELVGVMHLEDEDGDPVAANRDLLIKIDSTDEGAFSVDDVKIERGLMAALIFAQVGYSVPDTLTLHLVTENDITIDPEITGPRKDSLELVVEPLVTDVLSGTDFPIAIYLSESEEVRYYPEDLVLSIPPNEFITIEPKILKKGQSITLLDSTSLKEGSVTLTLEAGEFSSDTVIDSLSSKPAEILLDYPETILTNFMNTFSIQLLDSDELPVFADKDIEIKLVANDQSIIDLPESVTIKEGNYYTIFDVEAKKVGTTELAILASDLPLSKFEIDVDSITPQISISSQDYVNPNTVFELTINVLHANSPLSGMNVQWNVQGAAIQNMDSVTNENGIAKISLLSQDPTRVDIQATVSGGIFPSSTVSKQINVNIPLESPANTLNIPMLGTLGINPVFILIPVAAAVGGIIVLKKKNMLTGLTEKISVIEKINEVKERISHLREK